MRWLGVLALLSGCQLIWPLTDSRDGGPGDADPDGPPRDASPFGSCSTIAMLGANFETGVDLRWQKEGNGTLDLNSGRAFLEGAMDSGVGFRAQHFYDLTNGVFAVDIAQVSSPTGRVGFHLLEAETGDELTIQITNNMIFGLRHPAVGQDLSRGVRAFNPGLTTRFQIRATDTEVFWEVVDNNQIVQIGAETRTVHFVRPQLFAQSSGPNETTSAVFDNVNSGEPVGTACPIADLADTFDPRPDPGPPFGVQWARSSEVECRHQFDGRLITTLNPMIGSSCFLTSSTVYDLTSGPVRAEVLELGNGTMRFGVLYDNESSMDFEFDPNERKLNAVTNNPFQVIDTRPYDPVAHRWWRFRYAAGATATLFLETSADGDTWAPFSQINESRIIDPLPASAFRIENFGAPMEQTQFLVGSVGP